MKVWCLFSCALSRCPRGMMIGRHRAAREASLSAHQVLARHVQVRPSENNGADSWANVSLIEYNMWEKRRKCLAGVNIIWLYFNLIADFLDKYYTKYVLVETILKMLTANLSRISIIEKSIKFHKFVICNQ